MAYLELFYDLRILFLTAVITLAVEIITLAGRFLLGVKIFDDTPGKLRELTFGYRLHHSYLGLAGLFAGMVFSGFAPAWVGWLYIGGIALLASDLIHHFCVLWPLTGHHEFFISFPD